MNPTENALIMKKRSRLPEGLTCRYWESDIMDILVSMNPNPLDSVTDLIDLSERTIEANSRFFDSPDQVPRQALSMGIKTIMQSRNIVLLISGNSKARIAAKALNGPITQNVPASVLQLHPFVTVVLDKEAAVYL